MVNLALIHDETCSAPSTYYELRPGGFLWLACRRCTATAIRRPEKESR